MVTTEEIKEKEAELTKLRAEAKTERAEAKAKKTSDLAEYRTKVKAEKGLVDGVLKEIYAWKKLGIRAKSTINIRERISAIVTSGGEE
jgi:hypothetical protein